MNNIFFERIQSKNSGLKVAIKDSIDISGYKTVAGSRALLNTEPAIKNAEVVDLIDQHQCQKYSPDLNPIEKMWSRVKSIRNKFRIKDIDELFKKYCDILFGI